MAEARKEKIVILRVREDTRVWKYLEEHKECAGSQTILKAIEEYIDIIEGVKTVPQRAVTLQGDTITLKEIAKFMKEISLQLQPVESYFFDEIIKKKKGEEN